MRAPHRLPRLLPQLALAAALVLLAGPALAKDARCMTTDDGFYPCWFKATDKQGSFTISAEGKPTYDIQVESPGVAFGFVTFSEDGPFVPLPGQYLRANDDRACWDNTETDTRICAW